MSSIDLPVIDNPPPPPPPALVVRYGYLRNIGEFAYDGDIHPGCGRKVVVRTRRGTELAEALATTCTDGSCARSVTREKIREYIEKSGGRDFPFSTEGRVLRIATPEDLAQQAKLDKQKPEYVAACKQLIRELELPMKLVDVEMLLGGEMTTFFFLSEHRIDFRALVKQLASRFHTRIQMHQVGSRDEARLVADYETCGEHCCCRQFLKVLKPVSMGSAKMQKATLDPSKISGRCGRLKCCLRYEEQGYEELRRKLPRVGSRVRVEDGIGVVIDTTIITQLVKIRLGEDRIVAVANEEILERDVPADAVAVPKPSPAPSAPAAESRREEARPQAREGRRREDRQQRQDRPPREGRAPREDRPRQQPPRQDKPAAPSANAQRPPQAQARIDARNARLARGRRGAPQQNPPQPAPPPQPQNENPTQMPAQEPVQQEPAQPRPVQRPPQTPPPQPQSAAEFDDLDDANEAAADSPQADNSSVPAQPNQPAPDQQPRGMGSLGRRRRRRRGRGRGPGPTSRDNTPGPAPEPF